MFENETIGILVGAAPLGAEKNILLNILQTKDCLSVAADGGLLFFTENRIPPDRWFGDRDSLRDETFKKAGEIFPKLILKACAPEKDDTDARLGMEFLKERGIKKVLLFGVFGGKRMDHTVANLQMMHEYKESGMLCIGVEENSYAYLLTSGEEVRYPKDTKGTISVFSLTENAGVRIEGLCYEYDGPMNNKRVFGVSNRFADRGGRILSRNGTLLIVHDILPDSPQKLFDEITKVQ